MERKFVSNPTHFIEVWQVEKGGIIFNSTDYMHKPLTIENFEPNNYCITIAVWKITPKN